MKTQTTQQILLSASLLAAAITSSGCKDDLSGGAITAYKFCARVTDTYSDRNPKPYTGVASFYNRSFFNVRGGTNLSTTLHNVKVQDGVYCSPEVELDDPLPAKFYNTPNPTLAAWLSFPSGCFLMSKTGTFSASNSEAGSGTLIETQEYEFRGSGCSSQKDPGENESLKGWPASLIPEVTPMPLATVVPANPSGYTSSPTCIGNLCIGRNLLFANRFAKGVYYYVGPVKEVNASSAAVNYEQQMMYNNVDEYRVNNSAFGGYSSEKVPAILLTVHGSEWASLELGKTPVTTPTLGPFPGWKFGNIYAGPAQTFKTDSLPVEFAQAEVLCLGNLCKGGTTRLKDGRPFPTQARVINLFGDAFTGHALIFKTLSDGSQGTDFIPVSMLEIAGGVSPAIPGSPSEPGPAKAPSFKICDDKTTDCDALIKPYAASTYSVALIGRIKGPSNSSYNGIQQQILSPQLALLEDKSAFLSIATAPKESGGFKNSDWAQTLIQQDPCQSKDPGLTVALLNLCKEEVQSYPFGYSGEEAGHFSSKTCIGAYCVKQTLHLRGSAQSPGMEGQILALFGTESAGYALLMTQTNQKVATLWTLADIKAASFEVPTQVTGAPAGTPPEKCVGGLCVGGTVMRTGVYTYNTFSLGSQSTYIDLGEITAVYPDGSVDWKPAFSLIDKTYDDKKLVHYLGSHWGALSWGALHDAPLRACQAVGTGSSYTMPSFENGCQVVKKQSGMLAETPCIGNLCEGQQLTSGENTIYVMNLFGDQANGMALVNRRAKDVNTFTTMSAASLLPLAPTLAQPKP